MGLTGFTVVAFSIFLVGALLMIIGHKNAAVNKKFFWFAIPSLILAIWALCTSWMWFYYFCLYISLPAWILSILLLLIASQFEKEKRLFRIVIGTQIAVLLLGFLSAGFFGMF